MRRLPEDQIWFILCTHTFVLRVNERTQDAYMNLYLQYTPMGIIIRKFL